MSENRAHEGRKTYDLFISGYETSTNIRLALFGGEHSSNPDSYLPKKQRGKRANARRRESEQRKRDSRMSRTLNVNGVKSKNGLLPILRSGKRVVFLARDCSLLGEYFHAPIAWGLNRRSIDKPYAKELVEAQIKPNDVVVDTGWSGSIPRGIARHVPSITSVLLSADSSAFCDIALSTEMNYGIRSRMVDFEHSPKEQENDDQGFTYSSLDREDRKRARAYRLGFIAGLLELNNTYRRMCDKRDKWQRLYDALDSKLVKYRQFKRAMRIQAMRVAVGDIVKLYRDHTYNVQLGSYTYAWSIVELDQYETDDLLEVYENGGDVQKYMRTYRYMKRSDAYKRLHIYTFYAGIKLAFKRLKRAEARVQYEIYVDMVRSQPVETLPSLWESENETH